MLVHVTTPPVPIRRSTPAVASRASLGAALVGLALVLMMWSGSATTAGATSTQSSGEHIESFESIVDVNADGSIDVTETIVYDFGAQQRHGIRRDIPVRFEWTGDPPDDAPAGATYDRVTPIDDISVGSPDGAPTDVERSDDSGIVSLRIGDPDRTISGRHTYVIRYRLGGVLSGFDEHDELYLNITGNGWDVAIDSSRAEIRVDGGAELDAVCFAGPVQSSLSCDSAETGPGTASFSQGQLSAGSGLTVVVGIPKGVVAEPESILEERWSVATAFSLTPLTAALSALMLFGTLGAVAGMGWRHGRDRRWSGGATDAAFGNVSGQEEKVPLGHASQDPVEFVPPEGIRPGHMGTLWDEQANHLDVSAMIVDLAVRGWMRIDELPAAESSFPWFGSHGSDYQLVRLVDPRTPIGADSLSNAEVILMDGLFRDGSPQKLSSLKTKFAERLGLVQGALYDDVVTLGWFPARPDRVRARWITIGIVATIVGAGIAYLAVRYTHLGLVALPLPLAGLALIATSSRFPSRTGRGTAMLGRVRGFRELFEAGEGERQRFAEQKHLFARYLPYAIVFGMADKWAETFAALGLTPEEMGLGVWYTSPYGYDPIRFGWAMGSFTTASAGSMAAAAPSSAGGASSGGSGFSGGFSGGGFGGGGGGSW